tara:strand:+ start:79 stop:462 length:384 start_codon:yes stop_codon:yes gene_type:complete
MVRKKNNKKKYDSTSITVAMSEVRSALNINEQNKSNKRKIKSNKREDALVLKEFIDEEEPLLLEEVFEDFKTQKIKYENIKNQILSRNISNLIKSDIEIWIKKNINIIVAQNVREVFNSIVVKHNKE